VAEYRYPPLRCDQCEELIPEGEEVWYQNLPFHAECLALLKHQADDRFAAFVKRGQGAAAPTERR